MVKDLTGLVRNRNQILYIGKLHRPLEFSKIVKSIKKTIKESNDRNGISQNDIITDGTVIKEMK